MEELSIAVRGTAALLHKRYVRCVSKLFGKVSCDGLGGGKSWVEAVVGENIRRYLICLITI